jgi:ribosomal protein S18 acetylase RimI-like enzyme
MGLIEGLFDACLSWIRERGLPQARLYVHQDNARAQGAYRKCGFALTGTYVDGSLGRELEMVRTI